MHPTKHLAQVMAFGVVLVIVVLLISVVMRWIDMSTGEFIDWIISIASFFWLIAIVTIPWNVHFEAKKVLSDAAHSIKKGIEIKADQVTYVKRLMRGSFWLAIALHLLSAIGLYTLAATGISAVGYVASGAALLLTGLRPAVRAHEYMVAQLASIRKQFKYPREDIVELRQRFAALESKLNLNNPKSWAANQQRSAKETRSELNRISSSLSSLRGTNQAEHARISSESKQEYERISREAQNAIAQITEDGQFLNHAREIIRFFKSA